MYYSVLFDYFMSKHDFHANINDILEKDVFIIESTEDLKKLILSENHEEIERYKFAIINFMKDLEIDHIKDAIHFGFLCGMEIKEMMLKYEGAI